MKKSRLYWIIAIAIVCVIAIVATVLLIGAGNKQKGNEDRTYVTRAEWIRLLGQNFGLTSYEQSAPYYSDVPTDHEAFVYTQSAREWNVLRDSKKFNPDNPATRAFVAETAILATLLDSDATLGEKSAEQLLQYAIQSEIVPSGDADDYMTVQECSLVIYMVKEHYLNLEVEDHATIVLNKTVVDYSSASGISKEGDFVTMPTDLGAAITEGTVFLISDENAGAALKAVSVETVNGQTIVKTTAAATEEIFEVLDFHVSGSPKFEDLIPLQEGITLYPIENVSPLSNNGSDAYIMNLSTATPLASGNKDKPLSFGADINITKGTLTPSVDFTDYFSVEAEKNYEELFGQAIPSDAGDVLMQSSTAIYRDANGKLALGEKGQWKQGYKITGKIWIKNLYAEADCAKNLSTFTGKIHYEFESSLSIKGTLDGEVPLFEEVYRSPYGVSIKFVVYVYLDMNGELSVGIKADQTTSVTYKNKQFKTTEDTDYETNVSICGGVSSGVKVEIIPRIEVIPNVCVISLVDISAKAGAAFDVDSTLHKSVDAAMICLDGEVSFPIVSISVGTNKETTANKLGIKATLKLVDKSGALLKSASKNLWHYEVSAAGANKVSKCTWGSGTTPGWSQGTTTPTTSPIDPSTSPTIPTTNPTDPSASPTTPPTSPTDPSTSPTTPTTEKTASNGLKMVLKNNSFYEVAGIGTCTDTDIVIPSTFEGLPVAWIGDAAFKGCSSLKSITIPNSVITICSDAFWDCTSLTSITIPNSVGPINHDAFRGCTSLKSITIPNSVTFIGAGAFRGCTSLTSITIPNSVTSLDFCVFSDCTSLTSITIPNSVTFIDELAFYGCTSLTSITIPNSVTSIGKYAFSSCTSLTSITIPNSVTSIGEYAFSSCTSLTSITIPNSVTSIGEGTFWDCTSLTSIAIPNSVTSIGEHAFWDCTSLTSIAIPNSVTSIGGGTFYGCTSLTSITIPNSVTSIGKYAFCDCTSLTSIAIPNSVTSIGEHAFWDCTSLTSIAIPNSVTSIGAGAFRGCTSLTSIIFEGTVEQWNICASQTITEGCLSLTGIICSNGTIRP